MSSILGKRRFTQLGYSVPLAVESVPRDTICTLFKLNPKQAEKEWGGMGMDSEVLCLSSTQGRRVFWLPSYYDVELFAPSPEPCLPACRHASCQYENELTL